MSKKVKEVGIRKIHGAQPADILYHFSREIMILILISFVIAVPVSLVLMKNWLLNYAFRTTIGIWIFIEGGIITVTIAILIIGWLSWKVSGSNPVGSLRYE